jgi:hypothetical protein
MTNQSFERGLRAFQKRAPFRPYRIELTSGSDFQVDHPEALVVLRGGLAVFVSADGTPTLFDHEGVAQLTDAAKSRSSR